MDLSSKGSGLAASLNQQAGVHGSACFHREPGGGRRRDSGPPFGDRSRAASAVCGRCGLSALSVSEPELALKELLPPLRAEGCGQGPPANAPCHPGHGQRQVCSVQKGSPPWMLSPFCPEGAGGCPGCSRHELLQALTTF